MTSRRRFYVPPGNIRDGIGFFPPDQAHRLRDVLRLRKGDKVDLFDGKGNVYFGIVDAVGREVRVCDLKRVELPEPSSPPLAMAAALIKPARFEWMLEKATELGVDEFIPLETLFSDIRLTQTGREPRLERWRRIVRQACEQCGRVVVPPIRRPMSFTEWLALEDFSHFTRILCYEGGGVPWSREGLPAGPIALCIGSEGGWDPIEIEAARQAGCRIVSLGPHILRAETAALAAITLIRFSREKQ